MLMSNLFHDLDSSAFRRWELTSFDTRVNKPEDDLSLAVASAPPVAAPVPMISEEELALLREQAHQEGYAAGYQEAYARGLQEGQQAGYADSEENMKPEIENIGKLLSGVSTEISALGQNTAEQILALAVSLAEKMVKTKIEYDEQVILSVIRNAIDSLPSVQKPAQLILNPIDLGVVKNTLGEQLAGDGWRLSSDAALERGGCRIETGQNLIDASIETRWDKVTAALHTETA